jgi:AraC-like DNA-binding protein
LRFHETATASAADVRLYSWGYCWGARALYIGPALGLSPHKNAVAVLAVGVSAPFGIARDPADPAAGYRSCRTVLIPPNTLHHLADTNDSMAFLYVDARSRDFEYLAALASEKTDRAAFDLSVETELIDLLARLEQGAIDWNEARRTLEDVLHPAPRQLIDPRVKRTLRRLHAEPAARPPLAELARDVGLSESRLRHLFKRETGVPLRRYRVWVAIGAAMRSVANGQNLTTAAHEAGFSSSAHFSASYRDMFGLEPSRLTRSRLTTISRQS